MNRRGKPNCRRSRTISFPNRDVTVALLLAIAPMLTSAGCSVLGREDDSSWGDRRFAARNQEPQPGRDTQERDKNDEARRQVRQVMEHYRQGRVEEAQELLQSPHHDNSDLISIYELEAQIALDMGDQQRYRNALTAVLDADPNSATTQNSAGKRLVQSGNVERGLQALQRAMELVPRTPVMPKTWPPFT